MASDGCLQPQVSVRSPAPLDYTKENIYAEICPSHTVDTFSGATQFTHVQEDGDGDGDGDYASLKYPASGPQSVSRIEINGGASKSAISYHTVYLGEEPLGERHAAHITTVELAGEDNIYNTLK
ncbi:GL20520 [Drosophila persimilis]|uniref:GL20520 n=2 Tax=Drosophila persimilis TaxID=7234 RepID=B4GKE1_DROPE|nr:GL20520 [Drosophila persimilis]